MDVGAVNHGDEAISARPPTAPPISAPDIQVENPAQSVIDSAETQPGRVGSSGVHLRIDAETRQIIAQIVDEANQVIRQIPSEEALKIATRFRDLTGALFNEAG